MIFWTAFLLGLLGSFHCIGMCGPIAMALPSRGMYRWPLIRSRLLYNTGRIITYALLGGIIALLGKGISFVTTQQYLSIGIGVIMILFIVIPAVPVLNLSFFNPALKLNTWIKKQFRGLFQKRASGTSFLIGLLNGILPCGLVYVALGGAAAAGGLINGIGYMILFGAGTMPMMLIASFVGKFINNNLRARINKLVPAFVIVLACLFIIRGLNLGIPYLSPELPKKALTEEMSVCH